ncbi:MAG: hypothetical protein FWG98_05570 [Candidatus Cloacimonetes bacterium]|nr:hypothetical protein [Candidatus Cloacimonadota bacterium]
MKESLIQWTFLQNLSELSKYLDFPIAKSIGQEINTDFGRIDFILEDKTQKQLIVELETVLDTKIKRDYCFEQTKRYKNVKFRENTDYCILYDIETNESAKSQLEKFAENENVLLRTYSLPIVKELYTKTVERMSLNVGLALPNPKNYTICYLRYLNKILKPFLDIKKEVLSKNELSLAFASEKSSGTNFNCYKRLALDFEMLIEDKNDFRLTENGKAYIANINPYVYSKLNVSSIDLTNEQKRILLKVLTNGNWTDKVHKINVYWFMRFIEVTNGDWFPNKKEIDRDKLEIVNSLFKVSYKSRTMYEFLSWCFNYCKELHLVERIVSTTDYDKLFLTPLGVEVNNIFSMDLLLKKSRLNLSFKEF